MYDTGEIWLFLLMENEGNRKFFGQIAEKRQAELFGRVLGDGHILIDWDSGEVVHYVETDRHEFITTEYTI